MEEEQKGLAGLGGSGGVDWSEYTEVEPARQGERADGVVVSVERGVLKDFVDKELLDKWFSSPSQEVICVLVEGKFQGVSVRDRKILTLPSDKGIRKNSNLYKWKRLFGSYPFVGQKVFLVADAEGFFRLTL